MTEFQEGRTYLWIYRWDFEAEIITGEPDGVDLVGDNGEFYSLENAAGPLTQDEYDRALLAIEGRDELLHEVEKIVATMPQYEQYLTELWQNAA